MNPCCCSLQVGGMVVSICDLIGSFTSTVVFCVSLIGFIAIESANPTKDDKNYEKYMIIKGKISALYIICGTSVACSGVRTISSIMLLWGIIDDSVVMMMIWLVTRIITTIISIGLNIAAFVSTPIKIEIATFQSVTIVVGLYFIWVIWALAKETKQTNTVRPHVRRFRRNL